MRKRATARASVVAAVALLFGCGGTDGSLSDGTAAPTGAPSSPPPPTSDGANPAPSKGTANGFSWAFSPTSVGFDCNEPPDKLLAKGVTHVTVGNATVFAGMQQVGGNDQDPVVARYDGSTKIFCEHSKKGGGVDGRAYGVTWDGAGKLYVVFTIVGGGTLFDSAARGGWLDRYGDGGASAKVSVIGALDATTGVVQRATYVSSKLLRNGQLKTNTLGPADAVHVLADGALEFYGQPAFCTLNPDKSLMCDTASSPSKDYPKGYVARFSPDLTSMTCASASGVSLVKQPCK